MKSGIVRTNGIDLHVVEDGSGPAVLLCHGFPETWVNAALLEFLAS